MERDQPVGLANRKRPEEDGIDQTEKRGARSNSECQTEDRNRGEADAVTERAGREAKISQQCFEHLAFLGVPWCFFVSWCPRGISFGYLRVTQMGDDQAS